MRFRVVIMSIAVVSSIGVSASICDVASANRLKLGWELMARGLPWTMKRGFPWLERHRRAVEKGCKENPLSCAGIGWMWYQGYYWGYRYWYPEYPDDRQRVVLVPRPLPHWVKQAGRNNEYWVKRAGRNND
jgi:hypothetical protein